MTKKVFFFVFLQEIYPQYLGSSCWNLPCMKKLQAATSAGMQKPKRNAQNIRKISGHPQSPAFQSFRFSVVNPCVQFCVPFLMTKCAVSGLSLFPMHFLQSVDSRLPFLTHILNPALVSSGPGIPEPSERKRELIDLINTLHPLGWKLAHSVLE